MKKIVSLDGLCLGQWACLLLGVLFRGGGGNVSERSLCPVLQCTGRIAIVTRVQKWTRVTIGAALVH